MKSTLLSFSRPAAQSLCAATLLMVASLAPAQTIASDASPTARVDAQKLPEDRGANAVWRDLKRLRTWASLMTIVAHPDDEDGGVLTYEARGNGVRTSLLTLTRGEGGQNVMSSDDYDALGLLRTNELLKADEYYGVDQYWTRVIDFGFSKTIEESFQQWGHERVLYDVVRAVRLNRPLVLTSTFVGGITDGHGQHQVSGEMAQEAFTAAGDPNVFPDQIREGLLPWSPLKVYERIPNYSLGSEGMFDYATGKWAPVRFYNYVSKQWSNGAPATNVEVPSGNSDALLGRTYLQISRQGWGQQKTQNGGGYVFLPGEANSAYHRNGSLVKSGDKESSLFDGIDTSLIGIASLAHGDSAFLKQGLQEVNQHVINAGLEFDPSRPEKIAPELRDGYLQTQKLIEVLKASSLSDADKANIGFELNIKLGQFSTALADALGLKLAAVVIPSSAAKQPGNLSLAAEETMQTATPGDEIYIRLHVSTSDRGAQDANLKLAKVSVVSPVQAASHIERIASPGLDKPGSTNGDGLFNVTIAKDTPGTRPYFSRPNTEQAYYDISDPRWLNRSFAPYPLEGWAEFNYDGVPVRVGEVVQTVHRVQGLGSLEEPLVIAPGISVGIDPAAGAVPLSATQFVLSAHLHSNLAGTSSGAVSLNLPSGWSSDPPRAEFSLRTNEDRDVSFTVHPSSLEAKNYEIHAVARSGNYEYSEGYRTVGYPGLRPYNLYRAAAYRARGVDVKVAPGLTVGYVMGTGDQVPQALEDLGIQPHLLSADDLASGDLSKYDTIVLGIRAYAARPELAADNGCLLDYVRAGGNLVVQYNSSEYDHDYGPYPYELGRSPEKVVDETDPVTVLVPRHPLMTWPNKITSADFDGWVEERGHSFMHSWDAHYTALTETHDPGQDPQRGGLLYARYGKGTYIYMSFAVYRQLPEAVPGAYRILANLVSAGKTK